MNMEKKNSKTGVTMDSKTNYNLRNPKSIINFKIPVNLIITQYQENKEFYDGLKKGDGIDFDAVLVGLGNEFKMHHLHGKRVKKNN